MLSDTEIGVGVMEIPGISKNKKEDSHRDKLKKINQFVFHQFANISDHAPYDIYFNMRISGFFNSSSRYVIAADLIPKKKGLGDYSNKDCVERTTVSNKLTFEESSEILTDSRYKLRAKMIKAGILPSPEMFTKACSDVLLGFPKASTQKKSPREDRTDEGRMILIKL